MKKLIRFGIRIWHEIKKDDIIAISYEITYKLLLSVFPFLIFLMSLISFFNITSNDFLLRIEPVIPDTIFNFIEKFIYEITEIRDTKVLSLSLVLTIYSSSSGFFSVIKGLNKAYNVEETRSFIRLRIISVALVFVFSLTIISTMLLVVLRDIMIDTIASFIEISMGMRGFLNFSSILVSLLLMLTAIVLIYKLAISKNVKTVHIIPGSLFTLLGWILASNLFNIYINRFSNFTRVYGNVANIFILVFWLNIMTVVLLIGSEINAHLIKNNAS